MTQNRRNDLILSEALHTLVEEGSVSEGSREYMVAQKVVRDGRSSLNDEERRLFDERVIPLLGEGYQP